MVNITTDPFHNEIKRRPARYGQWGIAPAYIGQDESFSALVRPSITRLSAYDQAVRKEPVIKQGLDIISLALTNMIGSYSHQNQEIEDFVNENIEHKLHRWIKEAVRACLWSGFSVGEVVKEYKLDPKGNLKVYIDDIVRFHPTQVNFVLNSYRRLTHGEKVWDSMYKSGIWVPFPQSLVSQSKYKNNPNVIGTLVRLPEENILHVTLRGDANNPWGQSELESVLPYHLYKETFRDCLWVALDRYGTPLIYVKVPPADSAEDIEALDGQVRKQTLAEAAEIALQNISSESGLVFTQISKDQPIEIGALTTGNNFSDSFQRAIDLCDENMQMGLGIPNLLIKNSQNHLGAGRSSEVQAEVFSEYIKSLYKLIVIPFTEQVIGNLIKQNYTGPDSRSCGTIHLKVSRSAELAIYGVIIDSYNQQGVLNPEDKDDNQFMREMIGAPIRKLTNADKQRIRDLQNKNKNIDPNLDKQMELEVTKQKLTAKTEVAKATAVAKLKPNPTAAKPTTAAPKKK